jgi:hypothetical protein
VALGLDRQVLLAPDRIARAAAKVASDPEQRWMLRLPRDVRRSYVEQVMGQPDEDVREEAWLLTQDRSVREGYRDEVVARRDDADPEMVWILGQDDAACRSYAEDVLDRAGDDEEQREVLEQVWALNRPAAVRQSFETEVLARQDDAPREFVWMLRQDDDVCRSYARFVLLGEDD